MGPIHELVQATERRNAFRTGPQHEVIGVGEHDVGTARAEPPTSCPSPSPACRPA